MSFKSRLTRLHLAVGELLGLTHYRNCWDCKRCHEAFASSRSVCCCDLYYDEDGVYAITDPCEAVWCERFERAVLSGGVQ